MSYYTTQYGSRTNTMGEVAPLFLIAFTLAGLFYFTGSNMSNIRDLDTELKFHRHPQTGREHTTW